MNFHKKTVFTTPDPYKNDSIILLCDLNLKKCYLQSNFQSEHESQTAFMCIVQRIANQTIAMGLFSVSGIPFWCWVVRWGGGRESLAISFKLVLVYIGTNLENDIPSMTLLFLKTFCDYMTQGSHSRKGNL